jgi:hypothetical protein
MSLYDDLPALNEKKEKEENTQGGWTNISSVAVKELEKRIAASVTSLAPMQILTGKKQPVIPAVSSHPALKSSYPKPKDVENYPASSPSSHQKETERQEVGVCF